mmetsp:Transcript_69308/g.112505  ORF Transcript_69308/g.112505 Transcript_69308/m.112505 type:complete len:103 (+) Transcript_69308:233-541(+)
MACEIVLVAHLLHLVRTVGVRARVVVRVLVLLAASLSLLSPMIVSVLAWVIVDGIRVAAGAGAGAVAAAADTADAVDAAVAADAGEAHPHAPARPDSEHLYP